jgi:hypothetical protein
MWKTFLFLKPIASFHSIIFSNYHQMLCYARAISQSQHSEAVNWFIAAMGNVVCFKEAVMGVS